MLNYPWAMFLFGVGFTIIGVLLVVAIATGRENYTACQSAEKGQDVCLRPLMDDRLAVRAGEKLEKGDRVYVDGISGMAYKVRG